MEKELSKEEMNHLKSLGWDFVPTGPEEWNWLKFDGEGGLATAQGGDEVWCRDLKGAIP